MSTNMAQLCKAGKHYSCWQACLGTAIRVLFSMWDVCHLEICYDHKHLDCSVNHRGCWRICNREKKRLWEHILSNHSTSTDLSPPSLPQFQADLLHPVHQIFSLITTSNKGKGSRGFHSKIYKETPVTKMKSRHFLHTPQNTAELFRSGRIISL